MNIPKLRFSNATEDWKEMELGEIGKVSMCKRIFKYETLPEGEIPFYKIGTFGKSPDAYLSTEKYEDYKQRFSFPNKGDILLSASGTIGRQVVYDGKPAYFQDSNIVWLDHNEKIVINAFLKYVYSRIKWITDGSTINRLYNNNLLKIRIRFPSVTEQNKIADFIGSVDGWIENLEKQKEAIEIYKKGMMQKIFSQQIRFKDDNGRDFPGWTKATVSDVGQVCGGGTPNTSKSSCWNGDINWFTPSEIKSKYVSNSIRKLTKKGISESSARLLPAGTLLLSSRATVGEVSIALRESSTNQGFQSINVNNENNNEFIYYWVNFNKKEFLKKANGSTFLEISGKEVRKLKLWLPVKDEQQKIAEFLSSIDLLFNSKQTQITKAKQWKKGLLQQMFV